MSTLAYTYDENINRIRMDKKTKYVVLEGVDDIPKYENAFRQIDPSLDFQPVAVGCKDKVLSLLGQTTNNNFVAIVDFDFGEKELPTDARLFSLKKYCIENYVISSHVLNALIGSLTASASETVATWFNITEWVNHTYETLKSLLKTLHYYQTKVLTDRVSWNSADLTFNGSWRFCTQKIQDLISSLFENNIPYQELASHNEYADMNELDITRYFPGKLLIKSLYLFIKEKFISKFFRPTKLTGACTNYAHFSTFASSFISLDVELREILTLANVRLKAQ